MSSISQRLIRMAGASRRFLEKGSRREIARFVLSRQNPDGGFRGRGSESDLYYTVFAAACLKALGARIPVWGLWRYARSFGAGGTLDLVHFACLVRLRMAFPMRRATRNRLLRRLADHRAESAYDLFLTLLAEDKLVETRHPAETPLVSPGDPTPNLAAALIVNRRSDPSTEKRLRARFCPGGGVAPTDQVAEPDLLSTATALFALVHAKGGLDGEWRRACLDYVSSLWRDSGGFAGHAADQFEDVEYTFYALLSIGCLMEE